MDFELQSEYDELKGRPLYIVRERLGFSEEMANKAGLLMRLGLKQADASHIACAMMCQADYFITTDKRILNKNICGKITK